MAVEHAPLTSDFPITNKQTNKPHWDFQVSCLMTPPHGIDEQFGNLAEAWSQL